MRLSRTVRALLLLTLTVCGLFALVSWSSSSSSSLSSSSAFASSSSSSSSLVDSSPPYDKAALHVFLRDGVQNVAIEMNYWLKLLQQLERPLVIHPPSGKKKKICSLFCSLKKRLISDQSFVSNCVIVCFDASSFADKLVQLSLKAVGLLHVGDERGFRQPKKLKAKKVFLCYFRWLFY
jgi:hypothetical protein